MARLIRTTIRPGEEILVEDAEYAQLLRQGLVYGEALPAPPDPDDVEVASFLDNETSQTYARLLAQLAAAVDAGTGVLPDALRAASVAAAAEDIDDRTTALGAAAAAAFGSRLAKRVGAIGDSITYIGGGGGNTPEALIQARSYMGWANVLLGHALNWVAVDGVSGAKITGAALPGKLAAMLPQVDILVAEFGTNDIADNHPMADIMAAFTAVFAQVAAAGKRLVLLNVPPRPLTTGQRPAWAQLNAWLRQQGQVAPGITIVDIAAYLSAATGTGAYVPAYTYDGTHPNAVGAQQMGRALAAALRPLIGPATVLPPPGTPDNLISLSASTWAGGAAAKPTAWFGAAGSPAFTQASRTDFIDGVWQQVVVPPGGATEIYALVSGWAPGDVVQGYLEFETTGAEPLRSGAGEQRFGLNLSAVNSSLANVGVQSDIFSYSATEPHQPVPSGTYLTMPFTVPATTTELTLRIAMNGGGTYRLGRVGSYKVT